MTDNKQFLHWLTLEESKPVKFSDLAHLMAQAMQPDADDVELALCEIDITAELKQAVANGALVVRNPNTLGSHTLPHGAALKNAVLIPYIDLHSFLEARGMGLRFTPHGNGPKYWTPQNAASALQIQESWHDGIRAEFQDQMQEAAQRGALIVLNPRTCLPYAPETVRSNYEYVVTPANVNAWLTTLDAPYRWEVHGISTQPQVDTKSPEQTQTQNQPLATNTIAQLFAGLPFPANRWASNLSAAKWLAPANRGKGEQGGAPATWCPLTVAQLVYDHEKDTRTKQRTLASLNSRFRNNPVLKPWKDAWDDYYGTFTEPGEA